VSLERFNENQVRIIFTLSIQTIYDGIISNQKLQRLDYMSPRQTLEEIVILSRD
jgi:hypothetical protein